MYWAKPLTKKRRVARAHAMCCTPQVRQIVDACTASIGAPRKIPLPAVMAILYFHAVSNPAAMTIPSIIRDVDDLSPSQLRNLGVPRGVNVTYKRLYSGVRALCEKAGDGIHVGHNHDLVVDAMTGEVQPCPEACPSMDLTPEELSTTLIRVSLPAAFPLTSCIAVDGTDVESFWAALRHPKLDKHGNEYFCADHDARRGKRTPTDRRSNPFYTGYEAHVATQVPPPGEESIAQVTIGLALRPGVTDRAGAARNLIQAISRWQRVDEALFDRGYTTAKPENFARPLRALGILVVQDLHTTQRGVTAGPIPHTLWIDGALYSDAIPPGLRDLDPPEISMTTAERDTVRKAFDAREAYRFTPLNRHNDALGTQRFKGPALAGHVRCQNVSSSMRRGTLIPTTTCEQGADCGCGKTVTVLDTDHERDRQELPWQSTRWHESYKRRSLVEGLNAQFRFQNLNVNRGFIRMRGYGATNLLLAITLAGRNVCRLHDWYTTRELPDPWGEELGEDPDDRILDHYTRTRGRRSRRGPPSEQHAPDNMTT